ncbi:hypothetical protein CYMTET_18992, partial [Cymbomonas tetramitiformis]
MAASWADVARQMPMRTDVQIRERWSNVLDPSIATHPWDAEEDKRLMAAVQKYTRLMPGDSQKRMQCQWSAVAKELSRTDNQCWRRFQ